jgi:DNA topoisomerase-1
MLAAEALAEVEPGESEQARKSAIVQAVDQVAAQLNNTRAVCRKNYVHPVIFESWLAGSLAARLASNGKPPSGLEPHEAAVVSLLKQAAA